MSVDSPRVGDSMSRPVIVMGPEESLIQAFRIMNHERIRHIPVVEGQQVVGILSDRDVMLHASPDNEGRPLIPDIPLAAAMSYHPHTCKEQSKISDVISLMRNRKIDSVVVTGEGKTLLGLITTSDLLDLLEASIEDGEIPFDFDITNFRDLVGSTTAYVGE